MQPDYINHYELSEYSLLEVTFLFTILYSSVHGILQARILEWAAISFSTFCYKSPQSPVGCAEHTSLRARGDCLRKQALSPGSPGAGVTCHHLASLHPRYLICKMGIITVLFHRQDALNLKKVMKVSKLCLEHSECSILAKRSNGDRNSQTAEKQVKR